MRKTLAVNVFGIILIATAATACSSGTTTATADPAAAAAGTVTTSAAGISNTGGSAGSAAASAVAAAGAAVSSAVAGMGSDGDLSGHCSAIKQADAQALMTTDVGAVKAVIGECSFAGGQIKMDLYDDPDKTYYGSNAGTAGHPLTGVGDEAIWYQPVAGVNAPWVDARKGTLTCSVSTPDDLSTTTLTYTGNAPFTKVTDDDAAAYAQKVGLLCADVFAAAG
ncbi:MAG: hypothetical protein ABJD68_00785 [Nakamurella sp.]